MITFEEYLAGKRIDAARFRQGEPMRWLEFEAIFGQMHPESFTTQKKFLLNDLRRRYLLPAIEKPAEKKAEEPAQSSPAGEPKPATRPLIKRPAAVLKKPPEST